jgi:4-hydroxybenzoate polyprenyltransferase
MRCCANKTCCAVSKKNKRPSSQPLAQNAATKHQVIGVVAALPAASFALLIQREPVAPVALPVRMHALPPLAASCIRLI